MPSEYGNSQSISIYIGKEYVRKLEQLAEKLDMKRSRVVALIIKDYLRNYNGDDLEES